jgi:hypothetical protein
MWHLSLTALMVAQATPVAPSLQTHEGVWIRSMFLILMGGSLLVLALRRLRQFKLRERYALLFMLIGLPFIGLAFWQDGVAWMAGYLNMQYNTLALICVSVFLFLAVFELLTIVSQQDRKITTLAQMVGILMERQNLNERVVRDDPENRAGMTKHRDAEDQN